MVKYPICFCCRHYDADKECCKAFPNGITEEILVYKMQDGKDKECANGIMFEALEER